MVTSDTHLLRPTYRRVVYLSRVEVVFRLRPFPYKDLLQYKFQKIPRSIFELFMKTVFTKSHKNGKESSSECVVMGLLF